MTPEERSRKIRSYGSAHQQLVAALEEFPREMWQFRQAPGRWTIHEIIVHIADSEANSYIRCRRLLAEPGGRVLGYDENQWARDLGYHEQSTDDALALFKWLRAAPHLRSVGEIASHIIGARARWFSSLMGEGGEELEAFAKWDRRGAPARGAEELIGGLEHTWQVMQTALNGWSSADWQQTWLGEFPGEPEVITRQWVIWHLIEHDLHHGGELSLTLGVHGVAGLSP